MSELYEKSLMKLELDGVLHQLSDCAGSSGGRGKRSPVSGFRVRETDRRAGKSGKQSNL